MKDKVVIVTGAFGALGRVVAQAFGDRGARVALVDVAPSAPAGLASACGKDALILGGVDLAKADDAKRVVDSVTGRFGRLDALVNIAGGFRWETLTDGTIDTWDLLYTMNVKTAATMCRAAIGALTASGAGRIVNVG